MSEPDTAPSGDESTAYIATDDAITSTVSGEWYFMFLQFSSSSNFNERDISENLSDVLSGSHLRQSYLQIPWFNIE